MNRIMEYILIFSLFFLLFNHFILSTKEGLENKCTTTMQNGCRNIAIEKNTQSSTYTKTILNNAKKATSSHGFSNRSHGPYDGPKQSCTLRASQCLAIRGIF